MLEVSDGRISLNEVVNLWIVEAPSVSCLKGRFDKFSSAEITNSATSGEHNWMYNNTYAYAQFKYTHNMQLCLVV